jgi:DNA-binding beta-propeller fold protein YncE
MKTIFLVVLALVVCQLGSTQTASSSGPLMYVGTLDKKLLVIDEGKQEVVDQIPLGGIPRSTVLSADRKTLYIISTQMLIETVDLPSRKVTGSFSLADARTRPRLQGNAPDLINIGSNTRFSGLAVDPQGHYIYTTMRAVLKDLDQYRIEAPQFVAIDLQDKKIAKTWQFPKGMDQGFGFNATYKVSKDGKLLYVFEEDILVFDLSTFQQVDRIELSQPPNPGETPYRLAAGEDPFDSPDTVTSVFTSVDEVVHKGTLGLATIDLPTHKVEYHPIGPLLPMMGFLLSPDRKRGYSVMPIMGTGANRATEWWVWDIPTHKVIKKQEFDSRPTFKFAVGGDGTKLYLYGAGSTLEIWDAATLKSLKLIYLNKDTTTNLVAIGR